MGAMANSAPLEVKLDIARGKAYASRNYNDLRHLYEKWGVDRSQLDWQLQLRQVRQHAEKFRPGEGAAGGPVRAADVRQHGDEWSYVAPPGPEQQRVADCDVAGRIRLLHRGCSYQDAVPRL